MNKQQIKSEAKSLVRNAAAFGYKIKHGHALEIIARMKGGVGGYNAAIAAPQPSSLVTEEELGDILNPVIIMISPDIGGELFKYEDEDARGEGLVQLIESTQSRSDGIPREFSYSDDAHEGSPADEVARWNGYRWVFLSDAIDLSNHDLFLCEECGKIFDIDDSCSHEEGLVCCTCKANMDVKACDAEELIEILGFDRSDVVFWVLGAYQCNFDTLSNEKKEQCVHAYRQRWYDNA